MKKMASLLRKYWLYLAGAIIGGVGGYIYWYFIGCSAGDCPITSSPLSSSLWGAILGALLLSSFSTKEKK